MTNHCPRSVWWSGLSSHGGSIFLVVEVLSPCLPVLFSISDTHVSLSVSSVNSGLASLDTLGVFWNNNCGWGVLEFFSGVWGSFHLNGRHVWRSSLSLEGGSISLVVKVLSPVLPILLSISDTHVRLSISSVDSGLGSHDSLRDTNSGRGLFELLSSVWSGLSLDP